jgi:nicotinic acid phosphoribosyltransferase
MKYSPSLLADQYKLSHPAQYPPNTEYVYANTTPRGSRMDGVDKVVVFGTQYLIEEYLIRNWQENFFSRPRNEVVAEFKRMTDYTLGKDAVNSELFGELHDLGYLPLHIKGLPEGTLCPVRVPLMTIINTNPKFYWLTNFIETLTQTVIWQAITSATIALEYRKILHRYWNETSDTDESFLGFQAHDFSMRGMSSIESGAISGAAHLLSFTGTDTITSIQFLEQYYNANIEKELVGASVPATEHAVVCAGGEEDELETFRRLIEDVYPSGIVSLVSDTWDFWKVLTDILPSLKEKVMKRDGKVVIRPDCYSSDTEILTNNGWKFFSQLSKEDLVAQVLDDNSREFVKPIEIIDQKYSGPMHHFRDYHGKVDLLVTPNHRMVILQDGKEKIVEASKLGKYGNHKQKMIRSASTKSDISNRLSNIDRLRIAFQADGSFQTNCGKHKIRFSFSKQRKIDRLVLLLKDLGIQYATYDLSDGKTEFNVTLPVEDFSKDFDWVEENTLTKEWCEDFIEECSYWDSCRRSEDRFKFDTTIISVANKVEYISLSAGYGVFKSSYIDNRSDVFSDVITLHIMKDNTVGGQSWKNTQVDYDGTVHCVKVPSGKVFVRRNRCTMISGNSGDPVKIVTGYFLKNVAVTSDEYLTAIERPSYHQKVWSDSSFDAVKTLDGKCFDINGDELTPEEIMGAIQILWNEFGGRINPKGYAELDSHIGLIYGDSITLSRCEQISERLARKGFASTNVVFGVGSYTYQYNTRDTFSLACKATWVQIDGVGKPIFKDPKTDNGTKKSAKGLLRVVRQNGELVLEDEVSPELEKTGELQTIFLNGKMYNETSLSAIRERLNAEFMSATKA